MKPRILIGIQARSNSFRFKGKSNMPWGQNTTVVGQVVKQAKRARQWLESIAGIDIALLCPEGDAIVDLMKNKVDIFEGSENDVLGRYFGAATEYESDYIVRLTGDCVWITSHMIAKIVRSALHYNADYCSNVLVRTFMEGLDCEMFSFKLLEFMDAGTHDEYDREHVTYRFLKDLHEEGVCSFKIHTVLSEFDNSFLKTSIDTKSEYLKSLEWLEDLELKKLTAKKFGSTSN